MLAKVRGNGDEGIVSGCFLRAFKTGYSSSRGSQKGASISPEMVTSHVVMSVGKKRSFGKWWLANRLCGLNRLSLWTYAQKFSAGLILPQGHWAVAGDIIDSSLLKGAGYSYYPRVEARDAATCPRMFKTDHRTKILCLQMSVLLM